MDKKEKIMHTTYVLIAQQGVHNTPVSQIAQQAGVAAGTIYHYFLSKEQLLAAVYAYLKERMGQALRRDIKPEMTFQETFAQYWKNMLDFYLNDKDAFEFLELCASSPVLPAGIKEQNVYHYNDVLEFLQSGMLRGILNTMPLPLMLALVHGSIVITLRFLQDYQQQDIQHILDAALHSCWKSVSAS
jgi:AcrR family transcriptional regulator